MSDAAAATAAAPAVKATKKRAGGAAKAKKPSADHPTYSEMIKAALRALKVRICLLCSLFLCVQHVP